MRDKYLGELEVDEDGSCAEGAYEHGGRSIDVFVLLEGEGPLPSEVDLCGGDPAGAIEAAIAAVRRGDDECAQEYVAHHLEELDGDELGALLGEGTAHDAAALRAALVPLGLTPPDPSAGGEGEPIVVDLGLGHDVTQYVLAVAVTLDGTVLEIEMES